MTRQQTNGRPRLPRTPIELQAAAADVRYEIKMMLYASERLTIVASPMQIPDDNLALEAFLLHYRNLRAFLCPSLQALSQDDVIASDFFDRPTSEDLAKRIEFEPDKERLDKSLAHISYTRAQFAADGQKDWDVPTMKAQMLRALLILQTLPPDRRRWFVDSGQE